MMTPRWVTVFNGARDGYQVPLALAEAGRLEALITDWYSPLDRPWFSALSAALPRRHRAVLQRRYACGLPSSLVRIRSMEAARQLFGLGGLDQIDERLGAAAGRLARSEAAGILAYSYYAHAAFTAYSRAGRRVLFQVQTHPMSLRALLHEEMALVPEAREVLGQETELAGSVKRVAGLVEAPLMAERCLVPSTYTRQSLVEHGVDATRISVVPYGVDLEQFHAPAEPPSGPFRVMFVGQLTQRKGLKYLLEAWRRLDLRDAELLLVGRGQMDRRLLAPYEGSFRLELNVHSRDRMRSLYQSSDVFCMPSIAESFGLVYLEAMACGTPVIGTPNTGAPDVVTEGENGFLVPIRRVDLLAERLLWCYENRSSLASLRDPARRRAEAFSWGRFRRGIIEALDRTEP